MFYINSRHCQKNCCILTTRKIMSCILVISFYLLSLSCLPSIYIKEKICTKNAFTILTYTICIRFAIQFDDRTNVDVFNSDDEYIWNAWYQTKSILIFSNIRIRRRLYVLSIMPNKSFIFCGNLISHWFSSQFNLRHFIVRHEHS